MNRSDLLRRGPLPAALCLLVALAGCGVAEPPPEIDLEAVLEVTRESLLEADAASPEGEIDEAGSREALLGLADVLERNYNARIPALYEASPISVAARSDASLMAVADTDGDREPDEGELPLWLIEIDGENARIVATGRSGEVRESGFSGTSLLAGYLLGSMLSRQRAAGVNTAALAAKRPISAQQARQARQAARARAGSGSFARGK